MYTALVMFVETLQSLTLNQVKSTVCVCVYYRGRNVGEFISVVRVCWTSAMGFLATDFPTYSCDGFSYVFM